MYTLRTRSAWAVQEAPSEMDANTQINTCHIHIVIKPTLQQCKIRQAGASKCMHVRVCVQHWKTWSGKLEFTAVNRSCRVSTASERVY
jgi:hypothetical protein